MPIGVVDATPSAWTELNIRKRTPAKLSATPVAFLKVMGSFRKRNAKNIVKMGPRVPRIPVSRGVAIVMAERKVSCGTKSPVRDARAILA